MAGLWLWQVSASDYDIRTEFLQDVEPSALGKLSFASH